MNKQVSKISSSTDQNFFRILVLGDKCVGKSGKNNL